MSKFHIVCDGIKDGYFADKYGAKGLKIDGIPVISPAVKFCDAPSETRSFAIVLEDKDAFAVSGFSWIHWTACNIHGDIAEDSSRNDPPYLQGVNSWISIQGGRKPRTQVSKYGGMAPPDKAHFYEIHAYCVDCDLPLENGFLMNELYHALSGHTLAEYTLGGWYKSE